LLGVIASQRKVWVTHELTFTHDSIIWYGAFSYFVDSLYQGFFPFWNPYMNCGEPFFLNINILHLLDPSTILLILIGKLAKVDLFLLHKYDLFLHYIIFVLGSYLFYRYVSKYKISAFIAFVIITFSSVNVSYLRQHAFVTAFYLFPWILLFILKFLEERKSNYLLCATLLLGISFNSYHLFFILISGAILLACIFLTGGLPKQKFGAIFRDRPIAIASFFIFLLLAANLLPHYLLYKNDVVSTLRIFEAPLKAYSYPRDFLNLLNPYAFVLYFLDCFFMSESFLYIGLIPLFFAIVGLWFSNHKYKKGFILSLALVMLLMLGGGFRFISKLLPPLSVIRNTHTFGAFFIFSLVYFVCLGIDVVFDFLYSSRFSFFKKRAVFFVLAIYVLFFLANDYFIRSFPSLAEKFPGNCPDNTLAAWYTGRSLQDILSGLFYMSNLNLVLFTLGLIVIFTVLMRNKLNRFIKYSVIICFILLDLLLFNRSVYKLVTMPSYSVGFSTPSDFVYDDSRLRVIYPKYPLYAFTPAMRKIFTACSTKILWITTHMYETKVFYEFINEQKISEDVKDVLMGVSAPKLRFIDKVVILPRDKIVEALNKADVNTAERALYIEETLPSESSGLARSKENVEAEGQPRGEIKVTSFNPNEVLINVYTERDSFLYYSDVFDKDWRVFIDNKEGKIYKTNLAFKSVVVRKGNHLVRFVYSPRLYKFGLFCYFSGLILGPAMIFIFRKRNAAIVRA
jgi:hypothetical protein